jgi:hypothetical protein
MKTIEMTTECNAQVFSMPSNNDAMEHSTIILDKDSEIPITVFLQRDPVRLAFTSMAPAPYLNGRAFTWFQRMKHIR